MRSLILSLVILFFASCGKEGADLSTATFSLAINGKGQLTRLSDNRSGRDHLPSGKTAPFISIRVGGRILPPNSMQFYQDRQALTFHFDTVGVALTVQAESKASHLRFEVTEAESLEMVEMVIWGPYPTTIREVIGETVGVVRGEDFAIGLQALNPKTLGGYPWTDNDCMPQIDIFEGDDYSDLSEEGKRYVLYRVEAAKPEEFGSTLQAYCRNRFEDRLIKNWGHERYLAPAYDDGGVIGSAIALFGCPVEEVLDYIEQVELTEGLPHPMIAGEWGKRSQRASSSYLIMGFGEDDIDRALEYTRQAGLHYLYHPGPFKTWGHFPLNDQFPNGWDGLKACAEKAREQNIFLGLHTLSNFITPDDEYVTPIPDSRLAKVGQTVLTATIGVADTEIPIEDPSLFEPAKSISMRTVLIGNELVQYQEAGTAAPWTLLGCQRGAFGTKATAHEQGDGVSLLADHAYKVFLSDADLTKEMAKTIARLFNETGIRQISFDGLEGNRSTGMGNYGEILMTNTWYEHLDEDVKTHYIADASRTSHFFWHIYTRMNWGEPWYAGFRESQAEYRFKNQAYFRRNLMPGMLGWFLMTEKTSMEDIEWMLARAAGYNAGFGFVCNYRSLEGNGQAGGILELIKRWETARMHRLFTQELQEKLRSTELEFHLEEDAQGDLILWSLHVGRLDYPLAERQPGETRWTTVNYKNPFGSQPLKFTATIPGQAGIRSLEIAIDNVSVLLLEEALQAGQILRYTGEGHVLVYSPEWVLLRKLPIDPAVLKLTGGDHILGMKIMATRSSDQPVKIEFSTRGNPKNIPAS